MKIIALYNLKGGVGKTAASANLAYLSAQDGAQTLLCDLDPGGSASYYFRVKPSAKFNSSKFIRGGKKITKNIKATDYQNLDILPSDLSFRNLDLVLNNLKKSRQRLKKILSPLQKDYEYLFLDCPPNITLASENVFFAADYLIVPFIPTILSLVSYQKMMKFFTDNDLKTAKLYAFFSMVELRKKMHREMMENISAGEKSFLKSYIPYASEIEKMGINREPVVHGLPKSKSALAYRQLWREIKDKCLMNYSG